MRLIDVDKYPCKGCPSFPYCNHQCISVQNWLKQYVDPVKHGHWIPIDGMSGKCSACGEESDYPLMCYEGTPSTRYEPYPHCPWCGAEMDEENDDE